jgi:hypothetical protein
VADGSISIEAHMKAQNDVTRTLGNLPEKPLYMSCAIRCRVPESWAIQYAAGLNYDKQLHIVRQAHDRSGHNRDYVLETAKALEALNIVDHELQVLAERLGDVPDAHPPKT